MAYEEDTIEVGLKKWHMRRIILKWILKKWHMRRIILKWVLKK
jgi:hypothetical protein